MATITWICRCWDCCSHFYSPERKTSKTMFTLIEEDKIDVLRKIINEKTGGLNKPDTGIAFAVPTTFVEGLNTNK